MHYVSSTYRNLGRFSYGFSLMERVLITGGHGGIGRQLSRKLSEDYEVHIIAKTSPRIIEGTHVHAADLTDFKKILRIVKAVRPAYVFHLAAVPDRADTLDHIQECFEVNTLGFANLLASLEGMPLQRLVHVGSAKPYGNIPAPFREDQKPEPACAYAISKLGAELLGLHALENGMPITLVRIATVYGTIPDTNPFILTTIQKMLANQKLDMTKGEQKREYIHVDDAVDALIIVAHSKKAKGELLNIGSGASYPIREIVALIKTLTRSKGAVHFGAIPYRTNEVWDMRLDSSKLKKITGWKPKISLEDGLARTIKAVKSHESI